MVAISLVRSAENIESVKQSLKTSEHGQKIKVFAKIENIEGLNNYEEILAVSDGIILMRQNLALELPSEKVYLAQKWMIQCANLAAKPIICAQQIFNSMIETSDHPSDQEASDVSTCVFDGTDGILLNEETSIGENGAASINFLSKICAEAERCIDYKAIFLDIKKWTPTTNISPSEGIAAQTVKTSQNLGVDLIIVQTENGKLPRYVAKYRPSVPVMAIGEDQGVLKNLAASRGIISCRYNKDDTDTLLAQAMRGAKE